MRSIIMVCLFISLSMFFVKASTEAELGWEYEGFWNQRVFGLAAISHDGSQIALKNCDHSADMCDIDIFDFNSREFLGILPVYSGAITDFRYSSTQNLLATAQQGWHSYLWNPPNEEPVVDIIRQNTWSLSVAFSPDGAYLAIGWRDGLIQILDVQREVIIREIPVQDEQGITKLLFSPDGRYLVSGGSTLLLWNTLDWSLNTILAYTDVPMVGLAFSPNSQHIAVTYRDRKVQLISIPSGELFEIIPGGSDKNLSITNPLISNDGRFLIFAMELADVGVVASQLLVYDMETLSYRGEVHQEGKFVQLLLSPDNQHLYAATYWIGLHSWRIGD